MKPPEMFTGQSEIFYVAPKPIISFMRRTLLEIRDGLIGFDGIERFSIEQLSVESN